MLRTFARTLSLAAAAAVVAITVFYPRAVAADGAHVPYPGFVLMMLGMSAAWVYGLGFVPQHPILRFLFSPWAAWPLLAAGAFIVFG